MFILTLDHTSLSIREEDFVRYIHSRSSIHYFKSIQQYIYGVHFDNVLY